jgi:phosphohistidine phosphatase
MIVGHNPALSDLLTLLVLGKRRPGPVICDLKKGGIAALEPSTSSPDRYDLLWIATPRLIRRLAGGGTR